LCVALKVREGQATGVSNIFPSTLCGFCWYVPHDNLSACTGCCEDILPTSVYEV